MIKKEKECNEEEDNNSTISNKQKRKDMSPQICITMSHISSFSTYLRCIQDNHCKYCNVLMLHSGNIKKAIMDDRNEKLLHPVEIL